MINEKIKEAMATDGILSIPALNGIVGHIREQLKDTSKLDLFNQQFSKLHPDFYEKLQNNHPELTKSELKFCAFLKLKLSSHQISSILNVSSEAIRKSRYRIRKKMNLPRETDLEDYISKF
jgi:AraC family transcriptional regulator, chitin signaling transcriptional activator